MLFCKYLSLLTIPKLFGCKMYIIRTSSSSDAPTCVQSVHGGVVKVLIFHFSAFILEYFDLFRFLNTTLTDAKFSVIYWIKLRMFIYRTNPNREPESVACYCKKEWSFQLYVLVWITRIPYTRVSGFLSLSSKYFRQWFF